MNIHQRVKTTVALARGEQFERVDRSTGRRLRVHRLDFYNTGTIWGVGPKERRDGKIGKAEGRTLLKAHDLPGWLLADLLTALTDRPEWLRMDGDLD